MFPINNALSAGSALLQQAQSSIGQRAGELAQMAGSHSANIARTSNIESLTGLQQAETYALSGIKVIQAADNVIGTLLDIRA
ncbi:hypothetical protein A8C75_20790 [Marinobacterium aestuarii]|uniref:Flagellar biosynthesis protein FlgE n=1 Tax=Marinobacterium aestuarii TaxID=1821621 RepID=A0A1A9F2Y6_9GAMM|nr:hypothetical protein [Marinobacterium aestuarii]ANG64674.1 hypothetical protein A8C75_20790 [Marinobacterium aestuarii]